LKNGFTDFQREIGYSAHMTWANVYSVVGGNVLVLSVMEHWNIKQMWNYIF